jgi:hypothetical protein
LKKIPYNLLFSDNKEFPFPGAQINVVGKTENPEHLAVLEAEEPVRGKRHYIYVCFHEIHEVNIIIFYCFLYI